MMVAQCPCREAAADAMDKSILWLRYFDRLKQEYRQQIDKHLLPTMRWRLPASFGSSLVQNSLCRVTQLQGQARSVADFTRLLPLFLC